MKTALIIEDERYSADRLLKLVSSETSLQVIDVLYSVDSAKKWFTNNQTPDVIFLDIQLGDGTGFDILDQIEANYPCIIFTTAFDQYTLQAFKYNSVDYLLKPIKPDDLKRAVLKFEKINTGDLESKIENLRSDLIKNYRNKFLIKVGLKFRSILANEIAYISSVKGSSYIHTKKEERLIIDDSLDTLIQELDPTLFFRINRHLILRIDSIESIDSFFNGRLILKLNPSFNEDVIVSRDKVRLFKKWLDY